MPRVRQSELPSGVSIKKDTLHGTECFRVSLGKKFTGKKDPIRRRFPTLKLAHAWLFGEAQEKKVQVESVLDLQARHGEAAFKLSHEQLAEAIAAFKACSEAGVGLTASVEMGVAHAKPASGKISVEDATTKMIAEKTEDGCSPAHTTELKKKITRFKKWLPQGKQKNISFVSVLDVRAFIDEVGKTSGNKRAIRRNLSPLFAWAVEHGYIPRNPCTKMAVGRRRNASQKMAVNPDGEKVRVVRFKVVDLRRALALLKNGFELAAPPAEPQREKFNKKFGALLVRVAPMKLIPWFVLGCFAGLRPEEAEKFRWEWVDFDNSQLDVPRHIAKDRQDRYPAIEPVLRDWLKAFECKKGAMKPRNFRRLKQALTRKLGWKKWPIDITRHSYGSFHLAKYKNAGLTCEYMGHTSPKTLKSYYREAVKNPQEILDYWDSTPESA
jgi:integrase